jgi:type III secretion system (T3SS) inner membrane Yop/YscD-like protein
MATTLHVVVGPDTGAVWTLPRTGRLSLGSDAAGDLVLTDSKVAARHCVIEPHRIGASLRALAPTFVNGLPMVKPTVEAGDTILDLIRFGGQVA